MFLVTDNDLSYFLPRCRNRLEEASCFVPRKKIPPTSFLQWLALIEEHPWYPHFPSGGRSRSVVSKVRNGEQGGYLRLQKVYRPIAFPRVSGDRLSSIRNQVWRGPTTKLPGFSFSCETTSTYLKAICLNCPYNPPISELHELPSHLNPLSECLPGRELGKSARRNNSLLSHPRWRGSTSSRRGWKTLPVEAHTPEAQAALQSSDTCI